MGLGREDSETPGCRRPGLGDVILVLQARVKQTIGFIEISIEAGILLGGNLKHEACCVLGVAGIEPMPS